MGYERRLPDISSLSPILLDYTLPSLHSSFLKIFLLWMGRFGNKEL